MGSLFFNVTELVRLFGLGIIKLFLIFSDGRRELLNTCVVYGPNSAGKSNLFLAMDLLKHFVLNSQTFRPGEELHFEPFLFNKDKEKEPTALEILISL